MNGQVNKKTATIRKCRFKKTNTELLPYICCQKQNKVNMDDNKHWSGGRITEILLIC